MRKNIIISVITLVATLFSVSALDKVSTSTGRFLNAQKSSRPALAGQASSSGNLPAVNSAGTVQCFISLNDGSKIDDIIAGGGVINARFGNNLVLATVPADNIMQVAGNTSVKQVSTPRVMKMKTDVARDVTKAEDVWSGINNGLPYDYDGTGVVLGIIDCGIEYNHLAFKDANGVSRVKRVYDPRTSATGGSEVTINGNTLTGRHYTTESQIAALTCDTDDESHGTHTTGCAGGSVVGKYSGMAPGVDFVLCGCAEDLTDASISQCALYIAEYAKSVGKPCVISISLGTSVGPHDGTSPICQVYDQIAEEYNAVILLANGNEADLNGSIIKTLTTSDTETPGVATVWAPVSGYSYLSGELDIWNDSSNPLALKLVLLSSSGSVVKETEIINATDADGLEITDFASYYASSAKLMVYSGVDEVNNRYNIYISSDLKKKTSSSATYYLGVLIYGAEGDKVSMFTDMWTTQLSRRSSSAYTFTAGTGSCSMCDDVTGKKTISVGAVYSRSSYPAYGGSYTSSVSNSSSGNVGSIAYFSSYGTDCNGVNHPFISAPGHSVVSSVNRYDSSNSSYYVSQSVAISSGSSTMDMWDGMSGTSMATPVCAGVVALWKQIAPDFDVNQIKNVMSKTAINDTYMPSQNVRWGYGKVDALAGAEYIIELLEEQETPDDYILGDVNYDKAINVFDVVSTALYITDKKTGRFIFKAADLDENGTIDVADLVGIVNLSLGLEATAQQAPAYIMRNVKNVSPQEELSVSPVTLSAGESRDITIDLSNYHDYTALQLDLNLPQGVKVTGAQLSSRAASHTISTGTLRNGDTRLLVYSPSNLLIEGNSGAVVTLTLTADNAFDNSGDIIINNIILVDPALHRTRLNGTQVDVTSTVTGVNQLSGSELTVYTNGGRVIVDTPQATKMTIATIDGRCTIVQLNQGHNEYDLPSRGIYIVKVEDKTLKINNNR